MLLNNKIELKYRIALFLPAILLIFSGCRTEIEFKAAERQSKIVLNSAVYIDSLITCYVHRTVLSLESNQTIQPLTDALVILQTEGVTIDTLQHVNKGFYKSKVYAQADKAYQFIVTREGFTTVRAQSQIIIPTQIVSLEKISTQYYSIEGVHVTTFRLRIEKDSQNQGFYAFIPYKKRYQPLYDMYGNIVDSVLYYYSVYLNLDRSKGIEFSRMVEVFDGTYSSYIEKHYFTDKLESSNNTSIIDFALESYNDHDFNGNLFIDVEKISQDMFYYYQSLTALQNNNDFSFFTQPVQVFSNIEGGVGIVGTIKKYETILYQENKEN
ncbi:MAG TPA: DUF4249 family protein [Salinivirgaceae bacterium]|nr:DUF4249 family protein [Salinivirgaceae bacterium]